MIPWPGCCGMGRKQTPCCDDAGIASRPSTNPKIAKTSVPCKQWKGVFECCVECKGDVRYSWRHAGEAPVLVLGYCGLSRKGPDYCVPSALASPWLLCCSTLSLPLSNSFIPSIGTLNSVSASLSISTCPGVFRPNPNPSISAARSMTFGPRTSSAAVVSDCPLDPSDLPMGYLLLVIETYATSPGNMGVSKGNTPGDDDNCAVRLSSSDPDCKEVSALRIM